MNITSRAPAVSAAIIIDVCYASCWNPQGETISKLTLETLKITPKIKFCGEMHKNLKMQYLGVLI